MKNFKWKNISITKKVFFITLLSIVIMLMLFFAIQSVLYSRIYSYTKENAMKQMVINLADEYKMLTDKNQMRKKISEYSANNNAYIMVADDRGIKYAVSYEMEIESDNGEKMSFLLDNAVNSNDFMNLNIEQGDTVSVKFVKFDRGDTGIYVPETISKGGNKWENTSLMNFRNPRSEGERRPSRFVHRSETVSGRVTSIVTPVAYNGIIQRSDALSALMSWVENPEDISYGEPVTYRYVSNESKELYSVAVMMLDDSEFIFATTSLRHISEAMGVLNGLIIPWTIIAGIMALVVGASFSYMITKPILRLTKITTKMKNLDFSEHCSVLGSDELGVLSNNVNEMSDKLDTTIKELVAANDKLTEDINHERMLEQQRKEFVAAVSHELKTPLAIIRAYAEGLIDGVSENKRLKYMNVIVEETKKMDTLVLDMLENSKLEAGVEKLNIKEYSITKIINKYVKLFDENFKQKSITVEFNSDEEAIVEVDCDKMELVISNFLTNALKNTPESGKITLYITQTESEVEVSVENTGAHIDESELSKVWDKFYKCDKSRERKDNGTGLGLSISKNILLLHKAEYGVNNTEDGVRFFFILKKKLDKDI